LLNYKNSTLKFIQIIHIIQERLNVELAFKDFERTLKLTYTAALSNEISFKLESLKREFVSFSSFAFKKKKNFIKEIFKLRQYYINKLTKYIFSILSKAIFDSSFIFTFKKIFFLLRMINTGKLNINIGHTPFFFKAGYRYFKDSDQKLLFKKVRHKCLYFFREASQIENYFFLKNLKLSIFKGYAESLINSRFTFLSLEGFFFNLLSLNTKLLSLKTENFSTRLSRFLRRKKKKIYNLIDKKIVDDKVITDKFSLTNKTTLNFYKTNVPFYIDLPKKSLPLKTTENI